MKTLKTLILLLIVLSSIFCSCITNSSQHITSENIVFDDRNDSIIENEIINSTINSILDSIYGHIMLNLHYDTNLYKTVYYHDTLLAQRRSYPEFENISFLKDIPFDTIEKTRHIKLYINLDKSKKGKEFKTISTLSELENLRNLNNDHHVFLGFNRVVLNKEKNLGFYNIDLSCSYNAGVEYTALVKRVNDSWIVVRIAETAIR